MGLGAVSAAVARCRGDRAREGRSRTERWLHRVRRAFPLVRSQARPRTGRRTVCGVERPRLRQAECTLARLGGLIAGLGLGQTPRARGAHVMARTVGGGRGGRQWLWSHFELRS